jgi:hypothetical protein
VPGDPIIGSRTYKEGHVKPVRRICHLKRIAAGITANSHDGLFFTDERLDRLFSRPGISLIIPEGQLQRLSLYSIFVDIMISRKNVNTQKTGRYPVDRIMGDPPIGRQP